MRVSLTSIGDSDSHRDVGSRFTIRVRAKPSTVCVWLALRLFYNFPPSLLQTISSCLRAYRDTEVDNSLNEPQKLSSLSGGFRELHFPWIFSRTFNQSTGKHRLPLTSEINSRCSPFAVSQKSIHHISTLPFIPRETSMTRVLNMVLVGAVSTASTFPRAR